MKQKLLTILLTLLPIMVSADEVEIDGIYYNIIKKVGQAEVISNPNKYSGSVVIPESIVYEGKNYSVTSIGNSAFSDCSGLTSVSIPNSVTSIGGSAFYNCRGLTSVTIPNSVTSISDGSFLGCSGLTSVIIPNSVTSIGDSAFSGCRGLTSVIIPNNVTSIGEWSFYDCSSLASVHITDLAAWCNISFDSDYSNPLFYAQHLYLNGEEIRDLVIPNSVTSIGNYTFSVCRGLTSVIIPNSVTSIGKNAFRDCSGLTSVTIPNSVTSIGENAFSECSGLTSVTIPNSVTSIGSCAFYNCSGLTSVTIPNSVTSIVSAFERCSGLTSVTIPNSVTSISNWAFYGCSGLTSVTIGSGVRSIGYYAFAGCQELKDVYCLAENVPNTDANAFIDSYIDYSTLHVPASAVESYKATAPWSGFKEVVKIGKSEYTLTYKVDGEVYKEYSIEEGEAITPEAEPTKEGYTFSGWSEIPETMPANDVTVTGTFTINKYKLIYMVDGVEYKSFEIEYNSSITPEAEPTKEGYTFSGWSEIPETMPAEDVIVTGTFTVNQYILTYVVDGAVYKEYCYDYGSAIAPEAEPTKEGYTFSGWSEIPETMPANEVYVVGKFTINKYKITYVIDGVVFKTEEVEYGSTITPPNPGNHEGYDFAWEDYPTTMPAEDILIYGTYTPTGIEAILASEPDVKIFTVSGKPLNKLQKGVNILRYKDGRTRKIVVK